MDLSSLKDDADRDYGLLDVIVVGAGFAGMYMLHALRGRGLNVRVFETAEDVGGTWYWNRYPGARCDVVSVDYSYSFDSHIEAEWTWSEKYASQPEILAYADFVATRLGLRDYISFKTSVETAAFDEENSVWIVSTDRGDQFRARFLIMATGCLSMPKAPELRGLSEFEGPVLFTSLWPHDSIDFSQKRVGVIGTGSSGIQVSTAVAETAKALFVFQRTASFTLPARNTPLALDYISEIKSGYRQRRQEARRHPAGHLRPLTDRKTFDMEETERRRRFNDAWRVGGLAMFGEFGDLLVDARANAEITRYVYEKIDQLVEDPKTAEALKPKNIPFAGRRICLDTNFYEMFNRDNVTLVDVGADPIQAVVKEGMRTASTTYPLDALILAVGFDAMTGALLAVDIRGRGGVSLREKWAHGPVSYLGLAIEGFPNLFTITGPGSPSVLSNVIASIEQHVEWLANLISHMHEAGLREVEAGAQAEEDWVRYNYELAQNSLMMKANSWYLGANVPGKPRVFMPFIGGLVVYRDICDGLAAQGYKGFRFTDGRHEAARIGLEPGDIRP